IASFVGFPGKLLAKTQERDRSGIVRHRRRQIVLNLNNRGVEPPLIVKLNKPLDVNGLVLRGRRNFRQNFSGFLEPTLYLENRCLRRERSLVPGRNLQNAVKDRLCLVKTARGLERVGNS